MTKRILISGLVLVAVAVLLAAYLLHFGGPAHDARTGSTRDGESGREEALPRPRAIANAKRTSAVGATSNPTGASAEVAADGRCVDESGNPISAATLEYQLQGTDSLQKALQGATSPDGFFSIPFALPAQSPLTPTKLTIRAAGYCRIERYEMAQPGSPVHFGNIILARAGAVAGRVVDARNQPVPSALVEMVDYDRRWLARTLTAGENGEFTIPDAPAGNISFNAQAPDGRRGGPVYVNITESGEPARAEIVLGDPVDPNAVTGRVTYPGGLPAAGANIKFQVRQGGGGSTSSTQTGLNGQFVYNGKAGENLRIVASDPAGRFAPAILENVPAGTKNILLTLADAATLTIACVDSAGQPVTNFAAFPVDRDGKAYFTKPAATEWRDGLAPIVLPGERFFIQIQAPRFAPMKLGDFGDNMAGEIVRAQLVPAPGISGRVLENGEPVAGAKVILMKGAGRNYTYVRNGIRMRSLAEPGGATALTDSKGEYWLPVTKTLEYYLHAERRAPGANEVSAAGEAGPLDIDSSAGARDVDIYLTKGGALEGRVFGTPSESGAGRLVIISHGDDHPIIVKTDAQGAYRVNHLIPGNYQVTTQAAAAAGDSVEERKYKDGDTPPAMPVNCIIREGQVTQFDIRLESLGELKVWIECNISGLADFRLNGRIETMESGVARELGDATGTGKLQFQVPRMGDYRAFLSCALPNDELLQISEDVSVRSPEEKILIKVATGRIEGMVAEPAEREQVVLQYSEKGRQMQMITNATAGGKFTFDHAPAGKCQIFQASKRLPRDVEVRAGETVQFTLVK